MKLIFLVCVGSVLLAQSLPITRNPPPVPLPNMQDFVAAQALEQAAPIVLGAGKSAAPMPKDFKPLTDVPLSPTAAAAVQASEQWGSQTNTPAAGPDGRVLYSYGAGMPTVVCAPLRVCIVNPRRIANPPRSPQRRASIQVNIPQATGGVRRYQLRYAPRPQPKQSALSHAG